MTNQKFINFAKFKVQEWLGHNADNMDGISTDDIFVVWYSKTLQNHKALLGTRFTNHYFECTFNGDKGEMYMDVYDKVQNVCVKVIERNCGDNCDQMKREDEPLGLLHYVKSTFKDSLFSKALDEVRGDSNGESIDKSPTGSN